VTVWALEESRRPGDRGRASIGLWRVRLLVGLVSLCCAREGRRRARDHQRRPRTNPPRRRSRHLSAVHCDRRGERRPAGRAVSRTGRTADQHTNLTDAERRSCWTRSVVT